VTIGLINAGVAAYYYLNVVRMMFFDPSTARESLPNVTVAIPVQIILLVCVLATIWIGLYPPNVLDWANSASRHLLTFMF
jgi:NADH:ubiquinone oxidoreductase subunit 2 (subunit N)